MDPNFWWAPATTIFHVWLKRMHFYVSVKRMWFFKIIFVYEKYWNLLHCRVANSQAFILKLISFWNYPICSKKKKKIKYAAKKESEQIFQHVFIYGKIFWITYFQSLPKKSPSVFDNINLTHKKRIKITHFQGWFRIYSFQENT